MSLTAVAVHFPLLRGSRKPYNTSIKRPQKSVRCMKQEFWALDFDGVICDSCGESSLSAWKAASKLWPELFTASSVLEKKPEIIEKMRDVRPVVETGYENIVQIRCLLEGITVDEILTNWSTILPEFMSRWQLDRSNMVEIFGSTRDQWMKEDLKSWLAPNRIYEGLPEALSVVLSRAEVFIVTTKQARFTHTLLKDMAQVEFPMDKIISTTVSGQPKTEILNQLQQDFPEMKHLFIEDKLSTLEKVCLDEDLVEWNLFLADWGYNTDIERQRASKNQRIKILNLNDFAELLKNGKQ